MWSAVEVAASLVNPGQLVQHLQPALTSRWRQVKRGGFAVPDTGKCVPFAGIIYLRSRGRYAIR
jgi:hypothetical protein